MSQEVWPGEAFPLGATWDVVVGACVVVVFDFGGMSSGPSSYSASPRACRATTCAP